LDPDPTGPISSGSDRIRTQKHAQNHNISCTGIRAKTDQGYGTKNQVSVWFAPHVPVGIICIFAIRTSVYRYILLCLSIAVDFLISKKAYVLVGRQIFPIFRGVSWTYLGSGLLRYILMRVCRQSGLNPFTRPSSTLQYDNISYTQSVSKK
jgi:hypothetical protein